MGDIERFKQIRQRVRLRTGVETIPALIGDGSGAVLVSGKPGYVWVRVRQGEAWSKPFHAKLLTSVQTAHGNPVKLYYDDENELSVMSPDVGAQVVAGFNPVYNNPSAPVVQYINPDQVTPGLCGPSSPAGMYVKVLPWLIIRDGAVSFFPGGLSPTISAPSAGNHYLAGIFLKPDDTIEVSYSTAQNEVIGLDYSDVQEAIDGATVGSIPLAVFWIKSATTTITDKPWADLRGVVSSGAGERYASVQTTDATATTLASVSVSEQDCITVRALVRGAKSDYSAAVGGWVTGVVRRATGGNATLAGVDSGVVEDASGSPTFTIDADTSTQTARIRVTGEAATTYNWTCRYEVLR